MRVSLLAAGLLVALAAGCGESKPPASARPPRPAYLAHVPLLPHASVRDTTGSPDYQHLVYLAPVTLDTAAAFYRRELQDRGWRIMGDMGDTARVSLFLEKEGRPLWIQIRAGDGKVCQVTLTAAGSAGGVQGDTVAPPQRLR
jgi:hypothetical protein